MTGASGRLSRFFKTELSSQTSIRVRPDISVNSFSILGETGLSTLEGGGIVKGGPAGMSGAAAIVVFRTELEIEVWR